MSSEAITRNDLENIFNELLPIFYPVGSYYETSDTTFNPNTEWGGTWELEVAGQVHISSGTGYAVSGAETNTSDGGSKDAIVVSHSHGSSNTSYPYFLMTSATATNSKQTASGSTGQYSFWANAGGMYARNSTTSTVGSSGTDRNLPPYIVVNRWHRTA